MVLPEEIPEVKDNVELNKEINKILIDTAEIFEEIGAFKERAKHTKGKEMDWNKPISMIGLTVVLALILVAGAAIGYYGSQPQPSFWKGQMEGLSNELQDLNSSLQELKQGQGVLFQGEAELARMIQDINENITVNKQAMDWLTYLSESCTKLVDENNYINFRCRK